MGKYMKLGIAAAIMVCFAAGCKQKTEHSMLEERVKESQSAQEDGSEAVKSKGSSEAVKSNIEEFSPENSAEEDHYNEMIESHPAAVSYHDGRWKVRYIATIHEATDHIKAVRTYVSVDAPEDMTEEEMFEIADYYEFRDNAQFDIDGNYIGPRETDYTCYAVFYRGDTDEEMRRIKYMNGEEVEAIPQEASLFPSPMNRTNQEELGDWP